MNFATDLFEGQRVLLSNLLNAPIEGVIALRSEDGGEITVKFDKPVHITSFESGKSVFSLSDLKLFIGPDSATAPSGNSWSIRPIPEEGPSTKEEGA